MPGGAWQRLAAPAVFLWLALAAAPCLAQSALGQLEQAAGQNVTVPDVPAPTAVDGQSRQQQQPAAKQVPVVPDTRTVVTGTLIQGLGDAMYNPQALAKSRAINQKAMAAQQEVDAAHAWQALKDEQQRETDFQKQHAGIMASFGGTVGTAGEGFHLPASDEALRAAASAGFDTPIGGTPPGDHHDAPGPLASTGKPTPFFGDKLPAQDVRLLVEPENDPHVVDLRKAKEFVVRSLKEHEPGNAAPAKAATPATPATHPNLTSYPGIMAPGEPIIEPGPTPQQCAVLHRRLQNYLTQQQRFYKTILLASDQLDSWERQSRAALVHAMKDGLEYFTGVGLRALDEAGKAADAELLVLNSKRAQMLKDGVEVGPLEAAIRNLKHASSRGKLADALGGTVDAKSFLADGATVMVEQLSSAHDAVQAMLEDPRYSQYFQDTLPESRLAADIGTLVASSKIFSKWGAEKVPLIALAQLAVNETYNGMDFYLGFQRWRQANKINGKVLESAQSLQRHIDETATESLACR